MSAIEATKFILLVVAVILSVPVLSLIVRLSVFLTSLKNAVEAGARLQATHEKQIADHEYRISLLERPKLDRRASDVT